MKIFIASDHAGFSLKTKLIQELPVLLAQGQTSGTELIDLGPGDEKSVDYPDYAKKLCQSLLKENGSNPTAKGILICGSGQGMAITANRFTGIRAALCWDIPSAQLSRMHNDANVLCLGARLIPFGYALEIAKIWLTTPFAAGRHQGRLEKIDR